MKHCVIIPSFNSGDLLEPTLREVMKSRVHIFLVIDGSTDGSLRCAETLRHNYFNMRILQLQENRGKGGAVLEGMKEARKLGYTHALVFDSDGQHDARDIPKMILISQKKPEAMLIGVPVFGSEAPTLRVKGRRFGNWWTNFETLWGGIEDSLFGLRVYPIQQSIEVLEGITGGRRFDFETQLAVRLYWNGVPAIPFRSVVTYLEKDAGGVSHFKYIRDNLLLIRTHILLSLRALLIIPRLVRLRQINKAYRT